MTTYYLWKAKSSTPDTLIVYITDYKIIRADGKVKVNNDWIDAELVHIAPSKQECITFAEKLNKN